MARKQHYTTDAVLWQLAVDSNDYDMDPENDDFLLDADDFAAKSSDGDMVDEPVPYVLVFLVNAVWKVPVYKIITLFNKVLLFFFLFFFLFWLLLLLCLLPWQQYI